MYQSLRSSQSQAWKGFQCQLRVFSDQKLCAVSDCSSGRGHDLFGGDDAVAQSPIEYCSFLINSHCCIDSDLRDLSLSLSLTRERRRGGSSSSIREALCRKEINPPRCYLLRDKSPFSWSAPSIILSWVAIRATAEGGDSRCDRALLWGAWLKGLLYGDG